MKNMYCPFLVQYVLAKDCPTALSDNNDNLLLVIIIFFKCKLPLFHYF